MKFSSLARKTNRKFLIGATIVVLAILHFTFSRFIAIEIEKDSTETQAVNRQPVPPAQKIELPKPEIAETDEPAEPEIQRIFAPGAPANKLKSPVAAKRVAEKEAAPRKKVSAQRAGESKAERLRRLEKVLTGV